MLAATRLLYILALVDLGPLDVDEIVYVGDERLRLFLPAVVCFEIKVDVVRGVDRFAYLAHLASCQSLA